MLGYWTDYVEMVNGVGLGRITEEKLEEVVVITLTTGCRTG